jgi:hypothetical protein
VPDPLSLRAGQKFKEGVKYFYDGFRFKVREGTLL